MAFDAVVIDRRIILWQLFIVLTGLSLLDFELTRQLVVLDGPDAEVNPLMRQLIVSYGMHSILLVKVALLALLGFGIYFMRAAYMTYLKWVMFFTVAFQLFAVGVGFYCHSII